MHLYNESHIWKSLWILIVKKHREKGTFTNQPEYGEKELGNSTVGEPIIMTDLESAFFCWWWFRWKVEWENSWKQTVYYKNSLGSENAYGGGPQNEESMQFFDISCTAQPSHLIQHLLPQTQSVFVLFLYVLLVVD